MRYKLAEDAKPQVLLLLIATVITIALWFIPYAGILVYPIRLFVTFIHEGGHALMTLLTGGAVQSLTIASDGSGLTYSASTGWFASLLVSSAGYLGTTFFGVMMLALIRFNVSPKKILLGCGILIGVMTLVFGFISPVFNFLSLQVAYSSVLFTIVTGALLTVALITLAKFSTIRTANFAAAFLAIQCLLNSLSDLKTLFVINSPFSGSDIMNDAGNMANATGLPGIVWVFIWIGISIAMISVGLRLYAVNRARAAGESLFED